MYFSGTRIIESAYAEMDGEPIQVRRTWRQRLCLTSYRAWLTQPFEPWRRTYTVVPKVPAMYELPGGIIVAHPALMRELRRLFTAVSPTSGQEDR